MALLVSKTAKNHQVIRGIMFPTANENARGNEPRPALATTMLRALKRIEDDAE